MLGQFLWRRDIKAGKYSSGEYAVKNDEKIKDEKVEGLEHVEFSLDKREKL
jgi:hypothetical protein